MHTVSPPQVLVLTGNKTGSLSVTSWQPGLSGEIPALKQVQIFTMQVLRRRSRAGCQQEATKRRAARGPSPRLWRVCCGRAPAPSSGVLGMRVRPCKEPLDSDVPEFLSRLDNSQPSRLVQPLQPSETQFPHPAKGVGDWFWGSYK